jgi:hypothetical protein
MYNNLRGQFGEISHQATVVIQCTHDKKDMVDRMMVSRDEGDNYIVYDTPTLDMATCRIDRGDLVFQVGTSAAPRGNILNGAPPVTSHLNGLYVRKSGKHPDFSNLPANVQQKMRELYDNWKISESIRFIGVSLGATVPNPDDQGDQKTQITVRTQGTMAINHNGRANLHPGDTLLWRIPTAEEVAAMKKRFGRSHQKITLMTVPMRREHEKLDKALVERVKLGPVKDDLQARRNYEVDKFVDEARKVLIAAYALGNNPQQNVEELLKNLDADSDTFGKDGANVYMQDMAIVASTVGGETLLNTLVGAFMRLMLDLERRKIGKVLSYAKPGEKVDVLLGSG